MCNKGLSCFLYTFHCTENHIFIFQMSWKDGLSKKKPCCIMIFLVLLGKIMFLFLENMILILGRKWKMIFFKKIQGNMKFSSGPPKRRSFQKGSHRDMIFLVLSGNMVLFFSQKHNIFSLGRKPAMNLPKKYMEIWYFLCTSVGLTNLASRPPAEKKQGWPYRAKIHLKDTDIQDWHPGKDPSNSLYLHTDLYERFNASLSSGKNQNI